MDDRTDRLEEAVSSIRASLALLEDRIAALERRDRTMPVIDDAVDPVEDAARHDPIDSQLAAVLGSPTLVGRSLLVLAGAFLLRVLTERGTLAPGMGVATGLSYALIWIVVAALAARRGLRASAGFHVVTSAVIAGPLLFEAVASFGVLSPTAGAVALAGVTAAALPVSVRWRLQSAAWVVTVACVITAAAIATVRSPGEAATAVVVVLGIATLWYAGKLRWNALMWLAAGAADLAVVRLTTIATVSFELGPKVGPVHPAVVASLQALLILGFVGTFVIRSVRGGAPVGVFEFVQTVAVWAFGWGGAVRLAGANGWSTGGLAVVALAGAAAAYACAFGIVDRSQGRNAAFFYLSSLGLGLVLVGLQGVADTAVAVIWASLAVGVAAVGSRWNRVTLRVHAVVLIVAAWVAAGVGPVVASALGDVELAPETPRVAATVVVVLTLATTVVVAAGRRRGTGGWVRQLPLVVLVLQSALAVAAAMVTIVETVLPGGTAAAVETVALSTVTIGLAFTARRWGLSEAGWLVYPLLVATGLRMVARDLLSGRTVVLVIALAAYGVSLIVSTKMVKASLGVVGQGGPDDEAEGAENPGPGPGWTA